MSKTFRTKTRAEKHFTYDSEAKSPRLHTIWLAALHLQDEHLKKIGTPHTKTI